MPDPSRTPTSRAPITPPTTVGTDTAPRAGSYLVVELMTIEIVLVATETVEGPSVEISHDVVADVMFGHPDSVQGLT
ncbi:hypothetical protein RRF57_009149 [Xylaria bambusicola]|uniref:Uncharacterized protein n=1 Tax=Xylaria bambusicola TaxID=326684 RepID=A0AAN7UJ38_9PEZI